MMAKYRTATLSFCLDLTASDGVSLPVGVLVVAEANGRRIAAAYGISPSPSDDLGLDELALAVINDLPNLLRDHLELQMPRLGEQESLVRVLHQLHRALRNSLHVSAISEEISLEISDDTTPNELGVQLTRIAMQELIVCLKATRDQLLDHLSQIDPEFAGGRSQWWPLPSPPARQLLRA